MTASKPEFGRRPTVAEYVTEIVDKAPITQTEIARRLNYARPNIIAMWKSGSTRLPFDKVEPLARLTRTEPRRLMKLVLLEYHHALAEFIERHIGPIENRDEEELHIMDELCRAGVAPVDYKELRFMVPPAFYTRFKRAAEGEGVSMIEFLGEAFYHYEWTRGAL